MNAENNVIKLNDIFYVIIDDNEQKVSVVGCESYIKDLYIPLSINYQQKEYTVTQIAPCSFKDSEQISSVRFPSDSKLQKVENEAFSNSSLSYICIPQHLTIICERAFYYCTQLHKIDIPSDSELRIIEKEAFASSSIEKF